MRRLRYMLFGDPKVDFSKPVLPGLFQWANAFDAWGREGVISNVVSREDLETFDVIHVNWTSGHPSYISAIRDALGDSSTVVIANVDFSIGLHDVIDPFVMRDSLNKADMVFHVEPFGADRIGHYLDRDVAFLPHPVDIERIKKYRKGTIEPPVIACQYHRYGSTWATYYYATCHLLKEYPELRTMLYNVADHPRTCPSLEGKFSAISPVLPYPEYLEDFSNCYINVDLPPDYTQGRGIVDAAALGIPTVGSNTVFAQNFLFPDLAVNCVDSERVEEKIEGLLKNPWLMNFLIESAKDRSRYFDLYSSHARMVATLEERGLA